MNVTRINERITAPRVVLITSSGENKGEMPKFTALNLARDEGLDLVEVSTGRIPTCKLMDYGKLLYQKAKSSKNKQHSPGNKEIRVKYLTEEHDLKRQVAKAKEFLTEGHKVLFVMIVRGREKSVAQGLAKNKFADIVKDLTPSFKMSDIQENEKGYSITVSPFVS